MRKNEKTRKSSKSPENCISHTGTRPLRVVCKHPQTSVLVSTHSGDSNDDDDDDDDDVDDNNKKINPVSLPI